MSPELVIAAAIRIDGEVWKLPPPVRHCHLIDAWCYSHWRDGQPGRIGAHEQGFVTDAGRFVDRSEAAELAYEAGQVPRRKALLFSEDLW